MQLLLAQRTVQTNCRNKRSPASEQVLQQRPFTVHEKSSERLGFMMMMLPFILISISSGFARFDGSVVIVGSGPSGFGSRDHVHVPVSVCSGLIRVCMLIYYPWTATIKCAPYGTISTDLDFIFPIFHSRCSVTIQGSFFTLLPLFTTGMAFVVCVAGVHQN